MKTKQIESIGIVGVEVFFNHSELVAMKEFVEALKVLPTDNKYNFFERGKVLINGAIKLLEGIVPDEVMSVQEAYDSLFKHVEELVALEREVKESQLNK